ncbi:gluconokinase [Shewanella psychropiezotolerans]|uniref:Gluconokinase n=1 Tax=Shewanella psychropiezotolerans TaxID=2593655 RepID=A0ABX5WZG1_9GAMM|nr:MULTISPECIES: gluconokinase [Shewanella]MPY26544.1 gluconokinase [Shewanella sp. YLB-07]QDO83792.1 gluconokinase [Shewanella psychropiezotolerans]
MLGKSIIVMGVCGCGKSTVGSQLAEMIGAKFIDGDDLHPKANIIKMAKGKPLNDQDRGPWLERIRDAAYSIETKNETGIIVCSALKKSYRDLIRDGNKNVYFVHLYGDMALILDRMRQRKGHFMKESMVKSQFNTLEDPQLESKVMVVNIDGSQEEVISRSMIALKQAGLISSLSVKL